MTKNKTYCGICKSYKDRCRKNVEMFDDGCGDFELNNIFYCTKRNARMDTIACVTIRRAKRSGNGGKFLPTEHYNAVYGMCHEKCPEGRLIESLMEVKPFKINRREK